MINILVVRINFTNFVAHNYFLHSTRIHLPSCWRISLNTSFRDSLWVVNFLYLWMSENVFIGPSHINRNRILDSKLFFFFCSIWTIFNLLFVSGRSAVLHYIFIWNFTLVQDWQTTVCGPDLSLHLFLVQPSELRMVLLF